MNSIAISALAGVIMLVLAFAVTLTQSTQVTATEQTTPFPSREKIISVTGTATASVKPDLLAIQFGVETQEKTARQALESNSQMMAKVVNSLKSVGITEGEFSTSSLNIYPVYEYYNEPLGRQTQTLIGYRVSNILKVETGSLGKAADIIDNAVQSGVNRVDSVFYTLSPQKQQDVKDNLLEQAILNAKFRAETALAPLNHKIIGVKAVSLSEFGIPYPPPIPYYDAGFAEAKIAAPTPIFSSDQDVTTTANVIFLIGSN
jgi:hypothetical protein